MSLPTFDQPDWFDQAACQGQSDLMFDNYRIGKAAAICADCPVIKDCFSYAMSPGGWTPLGSDGAMLEMGMAGGVNMWERAALRRQGTTLTVGELRTYARRNVAGEGLKFVKRIRVKPAVRNTSRCDECPKTLYAKGKCYRHYLIDWKKRKAG